MVALAKVLASIRSPHHERALQALYGAVSQAHYCLSSWGPCVAGCSCSQPASSCQGASDAAHQCFKQAQPPYSLLTYPPGNPLPGQKLLHGPQTNSSHCVQGSGSTECRIQLRHKYSWHTSQHRQLHNPVTSVLCQPCSVALRPQQHVAWYSTSIGGWHRQFSSSAASAMCSSTGASTSSSIPSSDAAAQPQVLAKVEPRIAMVYTCTNCDTRSVKTFSRRSYEKGLVLVRCPGCTKLHLVADHLGWFGTKGWTIQDLEAEKGIRVKVVQAPSDLTSATSSEPGGSTTGLSLEDWVGWSRVEQLLEEVQQQHGKGGSQSYDTHATEHKNAASVATSASIRGTEPGASGPKGAQLTSSDAEGVVEVGPMDLERWRKVRDSAE